MTSKLYIYVDESGQDTAGRLFIVGLVAVRGVTAPLSEICLAIEADSGKGARKWSKTSTGRRAAYISAVLARSEVRGTLHYAVFKESRSYGQCTLDAIVAVLRAHSDYGDATVLIDGLNRASARDIGLALRRSGCRVSKVRGLNDETDPLIRLADAICGVVRASLEQEEQFDDLWERACREGFLTEVVPK